VANFFTIFLFKFQYFRVVSHKLIFHSVIQKISFVFTIPIWFLMTKIMFKLQEEYLMLVFFLEPLVFKSLVMHLLNLWKKNTICNFCKNFPLFRSYKMNNAFIDIIN
jgi:hypothetical protein